MNEMDKVFENNADPREGFHSIVETIFKVDLRAEYEVLERELVVNENEGDRGTLRKYLNRCEDNARRAHRLYLVANLEAEKAELDEQPVIGAMRRDTTELLQKEKDAGRRSKAITNEDVETMAAARYPMWREARERITKAKAAAEHLKRLADLWSSRCATARYLLDSAR